MYRQYLMSLKANNNSEFSKKVTDGERLDRREQSQLHRELLILKKTEDKAAADSTDQAINSTKDSDSQTITEVRPASHQPSADSNPPPLNNNVLEEEKSEEVLSLCRGCMDHKLPNLSKLIRIFTSSTFTDTKIERNSLMEHVYPRLKEKCLELGYEFQIVDMRWGVRDEAVDDHRSTELCLREIDLCQKLSAGPTFVTFLSHKYGYRPFPRVITESEFEEITKRISKEEDKTLVLKWFKKDLNFVPPAYVLQPISTYYPDFLNRAEPEKRDAAKTAFWKDSDEMQTILVNAVTQFISGEEADKYLVSVTEMEIQMGLLKEPMPNSRCLWFKRNITDIEKQEDSRMLGRFYECKGSTPAVVEEARQLLKDLKEKKIPGRLPSSSIIEYNVPWHPEGIVPDKVEQHASYIKQLCEDFEGRILRLVTQEIEERAKSAVKEPVVQEIVQHLIFCEEKCKQFYGRQEVLETIRRYVVSPTENQPLVIHGASGSGKTSIMAKAARMAWGWTGGEACVVLRFLGTTQDSSNIESLLRSILLQVFQYHLLKPARLPTTFKQLSRFFSVNLPALCLQKRVVLFLDSIDQLDVDLGARLCQWLPVKLTHGLRVIISTLPEEKYEVMPSLKAMIKEEAAFVAVPSLSLSDASRILSTWLEGAGRALTDDQFRLVVNAFNNCQLPLFLKLCFDQGLTWASYDSPALADSVRNIISFLFSNLERDHGQVLVSRALGYLTLCPSGLSEGELEDILSIDDVVLNDTYQFWTPPLRRLPPLLLARIRNALREYLVERGADNVRVMVWYHRQFIEAARDRYCSEPELCREMHGVMAEYYMGTWAGTPKPFCDSRGNSGSALRYVAGQPDRFRNKTYNLRKLVQLPEHLRKAGQVEKLKSACLFNFKFLHSKLSGKSMRALLVDVQLAREAFPEDAEISLICEVLQLAQGALTYAASTLAGQLVALLSPQISVGPHVQSLLEACSCPSVPSLICNKAILPQPGGQLIHVLNAHSKDTPWLSLSASGKMAVTCSEDRSVKVWDLEQAVNLRAIENVGKELVEVCFARQDSYALASHELGVSVINVKTGAIENEIPVFNKSCTLKIIVVDSRNLVIFPSAETLRAFDTSNWKEKFVIEKSKNNAEDNNRNDYYSQYSVTAWRQRYVAISPYMDDHFLDIFDLEEKTFLQRYEAFPPPKNDDDDDFCVNGLGFNSDESQLFFYSTIDCNIHVHDFPSMNPVKLITGSKAMNMEKCIILNDDNYLYTINRSSVVRFDLENDSFETVLDNETSLKECLLRSHQDLVTLDNDNVLRLWDLRRAPNSQNITVVRDTEFSARGDPVLFGGDRYQLQNHRVTMKTAEAKAEDRDHAAICIYDVVEQKLVHKTRFYTETKEFMDSVFIDEKRVLLQFDRKLFLYDLTKQEISFEFEGVTAKYISDFPVCTKRNEMWTATRGARRLKCYDLGTGKVKRLAKFPLKTKEGYVDNVCIVPDGSLILATDDDATVVYGFDPDTCEEVLQLSHRKDTFYSMSDFKFALDNSMLLCTFDVKMKEDITTLVVYSLPEKKLRHVCFDKQSYMLNMIKKKRGIVKNDEEIDMNVYCFDVVADSRAVTGSTDAIIRVWDIATGTLLTRLYGHTQDISDVFASSNKKSFYFASSSSVDGENSLRVWNLEDNSCVGVYKMHVEARNYSLLGNGKVVLGRYSSMQEPVHFIYADENGLFKFDGPPRFPWLESGDVEKRIDIKLSKPYEMIPGDMDSDEDIKSDDDDDDDSDGDEENDFNFSSDDGDKDD